ncbi:MAG: carbohydrate ABC transporter substrate-binding protein [Eggerthellaceae bacterium]|nr:carbohydrate ABC transporter substrate-binding protein [Eggerthellaceae bacterium]
MKARNTLRFAYSPLTQLRAACSPLTRLRTACIALVCMLLAISAILPLSSCSEAKSEKERVTVYLWSVDLLDSFAPYVSAQLPDVEIEWVAGNNDLDFYEFMYEHGELPDIITNRRFSVNDAANLNSALVDLSGTEVAASFYTTYLENYRNADGTVNWLPACGEVDGYIANKDLFDRYGIPLPTDYPSFVSACKAFESRAFTVSLVTSPTTIPASRCFRAPPSPSSTHLMGACGGSITKTASPLSSTMSSGLRYSATSKPSSRTPA